MLIFGVTGLAVMRYVTDIWNGKEYNKQSSMDVPNNRNEDNK